MVTPQKVMQPAGLQQQSPRFQSPMRSTRPMTQTVKTPRPRAATTRTRAPLNVRATVTTGQQMVATNSAMGARQRVTLTRLTNPNQIQPIISVGTPKTVVSIATPPRGPNVVRAQLPVYKTPQAQQTNIQSSPSTSNSSPLTEDLEDSIQAARITKQTTAIQTSDGNYAIVQQSPTSQQSTIDDSRLITLQSGTQMSVAEYKQRQASQSQVKQIPGIKPINRTVVQNRQPRFATPNVVRAQRPIMVSLRVDTFARINIPCND